MARYEVTMSVVVEANTEWEAFYRAVQGQYDPPQTIVEEDGIRRLPDPIYVLTDKGRDAIKERS